MKPTREKLEELERWSRFLNQEAEKFANHLMNLGHAPSPVRYTTRTVPISLWQSIVGLWKNLEWSRTKVVFDPVKPGEPGYEDALYESAIIFHPRALEMVKLPDETKT